MPRAYYLSLIFIPIGPYYVDSVARFDSEVIMTKHQYRGVQNIQIETMNLIKSPELKIQRLVHIINAYSDFSEE